MKNQKNSFSLFLCVLTFILLTATLSSCGLFAKKECEHVYTERVIAPTCAAEGYTEHTCTECGNVYKDVYTQKVAHPYRSAVVSPTCTAEGYTEHTCTVCGDSYRDAETQKIPHTYNDEVVSPTCTSEGYTEHTCTVCGDCYRDTTVVKLAHTYADEVIAPTCSSEGYTKHICSVCGDTYNDATTAMTAHRFNGASCAYCSTEEITDNITPDTEWYSADNVQFSITTAEQLAGLASLVNSGADFTNQVIYLEADVDLGYTEWIPIGNATYAFNGTFNGRGHTVSGLKINAAYSYVGLFGNVSGTVFDFSVEDASVYLKDAYEYVSIACGYSTSAISDVTVSGFIDAADSKYVGGVVGYMSLTSALITNNENRAMITGGDYTGGLIGYVTASATLQTDILSSVGDVTGATYVGGIFGYVNAKVGSSVYGASVSANIVGDCYVGGIVGKSDNVTVSTCSNDGSTVMAKSYLTSGESFYAYLGGYVGCGYSVNNCINNVDILYNSRGMYVGGIAGYLVNTVTSCENNGKINGYNNVGGIVGSINTTAALTVNSLKNNGDVSGRDYVGGIVGKYASTAATTLSALENSGNIVSNYCTGGIMGQCDNGSAVLTAANLVNAGDVTSTYDRVGGLFGFIKAATSSLIKNSSSSANIEGAFSVGGLVGYTATVSIKDCSNEGATVTATGWYTDGSTDYVWLGGYVGYGYIVTGCTNDSDITYDGTGIYVGGIVGYAIGDIQNCTNNGNITSKSSYVGGIAGEINSSTGRTFKNLNNAGDVVGVSYVGGIFGRLYQVNDTCGTEEYEKTKKYSNGARTSYYHKYRHTTTLDNLKNTGDVKASDVRVGGIIGYAYFRSNYDNTAFHCLTGYSSSNYKCNRQSNFRIVATNLSSTGAISALGCAGELIGYFDSDLTSPLTTYTVTGSITVNGETLEGAYDVGSNTNLTLSGRTVYVPETPEEDTENSENTENTENTETGATE